MSIEGMIVLATIGGFILIALAIQAVIWERDCRPKTPFDKEFKVIHDAWYDGYISDEKFATWANMLRRKYGVPERDYDKYPPGYGY